MSVGDGTAVAECFGERREVSLLLLGEDVAVGDYVLVQAGGFAFERVEPALAEAALAVMEELLSQAAPARSWGAQP